MKTIALTLALFCCTPIFANSWFFKRMTKIYQKSPDRSLAIAERVMRNRPQKPSPYFFASKYYCDKIEGARSAETRYRYVVKAISYARQFEKKAESDLLEYVEWNEFKYDLSTDAVQVRGELLAKNDLQRMRKLQKRIDKFDEDAEPLAYTSRLKPKKTNTTSYNVVRVNPDAPALMHGMPMGNEIIPSADPDKEKELLKMINAERKKKGLSILEWEEDLARACRYHAYDLATENYFSHASQDRKRGKLIEVGDTFDRIRKFYNKSFVNTENIAAGSSEPSGTYRQWYNSKGHYKNMFNESANKVGIGVFHDPNSTYGYYWVFCTAK